MACLTHILFLDVHVEFQSYSLTHTHTHTHTQVTCLVFPVGNKRDFEELPKYLKEGLEVHFASVYDDVFNVAFAEESL